MNCLNMFASTSFASGSIASTIYSAPTSETDFYFNGYSLATANIIISSMSVDDAGDSEYNTFNIPRDHGN